jgi:hypothetical protein
MSDTTHIVRQYLSKNGYPLEMYVAKQFRLAGFEVYQSSIYVDKETGKDREIDVTAYYVRHISNIQFSFKVIIECKYAKNVWVLFSGENPGFRDLKIDSFYCSNYAGGKLLSQLSEIKSFNTTVPFRIQEKLIYGLTEAKDGNGDDSRTTYKAVMTILNSLQYEKEVTKYERTFEVYIPIIVVQGKLCECYLNDSDSEEIKEIQEAQLLYKSNIYPGVFPLIEIISKDKVSEFANKLYNDLNSICTNHLSEIENLINSFPMEHSPIVA